MTNTINLPPHLRDSEKNHIVQVLTNYKWERCVTLTYRKETDTPDTLINLQNFIRRLNGMTHTTSDYWFSITDNPGGMTQSEEWKGEVFTPVHVHGVIRGVGRLTTDQIMRCWRTTPKEWVNPHTNQLEVRPFQLGISLKVDHYDLNPDWLWYMVNQTRQGWVLTNVKELVQGGGR
jgi:hypothetical protein